MKTSYYCLALHVDMFHESYEVQILENNDTYLPEKGIEHKLENSFGLLLLTS